MPKNKERVITLFWAVTLNSIYKVLAKGDKVVIKKVRGRDAVEIHVNEENIGKKLLVKYSGLHLEPEVLWTSMVTGIFSTRKEAEVVYKKNPKSLSRRLLMKAKVILDKLEEDDSLQVQVENRLFL